VKFFALFILIFLIAFNDSIANNNCFNCSPLAEVAITNKGLSKILESSMMSNFEIIRDTIDQRSQFRDISIDQSRCKQSTLGQKFGRDEIIPDECIGLPEVISDDFDAKTKLRPFKADITDMKLKKLDLKLITPIQCQNLECEFKVRANQIQIQGQIAVNYSDKNEKFIPQSQFEVNSTDKADLVYTTKAYINPKTGQLDDLVFLREGASQVHVGTNSLNVSIGLNQKFASTEAENSLYQKYFKKLQSGLNLKPQQIQSSQFAESQFNQFRQDLIAKFFLETGLRRDIITKNVDELIKNEYGGKQKILSEFKKINWPNPNKATDVTAFVKNPPMILLFFPDISKQLSKTALYAVAENSGYDNVRSAEFVQASVSALNQIQSVDVMNKALIEPWINQELVPAVEAQVNFELRNLRAYWNQLSMVPDLENKNWIPIDTAVIVDQNSRAINLIRAQITKNDPRCSSVMPSYTNHKDQDFDLRTQIGAPALQEYLTKMVQNKKMDLCFEPKNPETCEGGTQIKIKTAPKITCDQGDLVIDLDAEVKKSLFNVDAQAKIKLNLANCQGQPCIQLKDPSGKFKNVFLNLFFNGLLNQGLKAAFSGNAPMNFQVPSTHLNKLKTDPQTCETTLDWDILTHSN